MPSDAPLAPPGMPIYADATPADLVREIFALYDAGCTAEEIADILNRGGASALERAM
ncbi:hypothetical protein [Nonomuraea sp. NPDC052265]|uniref:hypothetical protein n=1 Tax=Nonomuraea sp. NPDC052265 TaxID=3364374 RepID=UPI0037C95E72